MNNELLNVNNSEWDIQNGTLCSYKGKSKDIVIPEGVQKIGVLALRGLMLKSVVFPDSLEIIDDEALKFNQLTEIVLPPNLISIGKEAFCINNLKRVSIPSNVQNIDVEAFLGNEISEMILSDKTITSIYTRNPKFFKQQESSLALTIDFCTDTIMNTLYLLKSFPGKIVLYEEQVPVYLRPKIENEILPKKNISYIERKPSITIASPNVVKYHLDEKPNKDTFEVIDGVLVKYHNISGNTDIEIPYGVKEIAPSVFRDILLTSVKIPDTVEKIGAYAFYQCLLKKVDLPKNLKYIGDYAFFDNCLTTLEIPENVEHLGANFHAKNPIQTLIVPSLKKMDKFGHSITNKISELVVDNSNGEAFETIRKFKGYINPSKIIVVGGKPLTKKEKRQIGEIFDNRFIHYLHVEWNKPQETLEKEHATPVEKADGLNIKDPDVQKYVDSIRELLIDATLDQRGVVEEKIKEIIEDYRQSLADLKSNINTKNSMTDSITLEITSSTPERLKANLLLNLENLFNEVKRKVPENAFEKEINEYEGMLDYVVVPIEDLNSTKEKVSFILAIANRFNIETLNQEFCKLLGGTKKKIKLLESYDALLLLKDEFATGIEELYKKSNHYQRFYGMLLGEGESELAKDITAARSIIESLDEASKIKYSAQFETLVNKFRIIGVNMEESAFEESFRREFQQLLENLAKEIPVIEKHKELLNSLYRSLKILTEDLPFSSAADSIESIVKDICDLLKDPLFTEEVAKENIEKVKRILKDQYDLLLKENKEEKSKDKEANSNNPYFIPNSWNMLREETILELKTLRALTELKLEIQYDLVKLQDIKTYDV